MVYWVTPSVSNPLPLSSPVLWWKLQIHLAFLLHLLKREKQIISFKNYEEPEVLLYVQINKLACHVVIDVASQLVAQQVHELQVSTGPLPLKLLRGHVKKVCPGWCHPQGRFVSELRNPQFYERFASKSAQPSPRGRNYLY